MNPNKIPYIIALYNYTSDIPLPLQIISIPAKVIGDGANYDSFVRIANAKLYKTICGAFITRVSELARRLRSELRLNKERDLS